MEKQLSEKQHYTIEERSDNIVEKMQQETTVSVPAPLNIVLRT